MPGRISCPTLVGREGEFQRIAALLETTTGAHPLVVIGGEAGIGKSRLLRAVLDAARDRGAVVLTGSCLPFAGQAVPYGPFVDVVRRQLAGDPDEALRLRLREALDLVRGGSQQAPAVQGQMFEQIILALESSAEDRDVVVALEDLHWSDTATRDLLAFLAPSIGSPRITLLSTVRTDESAHALRPLLVELDRSRRLERIDLEPLDADEVGEVVAGILDARPSRDLVEAISGRSGGNPFFVEELLAAGHGDDARLPPNLGEIVLARLASLPESVQEVLRHMAVIGERVPGPLLAAVMGFELGNLGDRLRQAREAHVVQPTTDGTYGFRHALVREALYADLLPHERRTIHETTAKVLAGRRGSRLLADPARSLLLARHWDAADRPAQAIPGLARAGELAARSHAHGDALDLFRRCIALCEEHPEAMPESLDLADLYDRAAGAAFLSNEMGTAVTLGQGAIALVDEIREPARAGSLYRRLCEYLWHNHQEGESIEATERAYALVPREGYPRERAFAVGARASALVVVSRFAEARAVVEEAVEIGRETEDSALLAIALGARAAARANLDDLAGGVADVEEAIEHARRSGDPDADSVAYLDSTSIMGLIAGDHSRALELIEEWAELQRGSRLDRARGSWLAGLAGELHMARGDWETADRLMTDAERIPSQGISTNELLMYLGILRTWQGRWDEAQELLDRAVANAATLIAQQAIGTVYGARAELRAWRGQSHEALRDVETARGRLLEPDDPLWTRRLYAAGTRAATDLAMARPTRRGQGDGASTYRERAEELVRALDYPGLPNLTVRLPETEAYRLTAAAELARIDGDGGDPDAWEHAAAAWVTAHRAEREAYAHWRLAAALLRRERRSDATDALRHAQQLATSIGARAVLIEIDRLAARARLRLPTSAVDSTAGRAPTSLGLTHREIEVLELVAEGLTNRQIAARLFISEKTAGVHVSNILAKLDVASRAQAAAVAVGAGLAGGP